MVPVLDQRIERRLGRRAKRIEQPADLREDLERLGMGTAPVQGGGDVLQPAPGTADGSPLPADQVRAIIDRVSFRWPHTDR